MILASCELHGRSGHAAGRELLAQMYFAQTGEPLPEICITERGKPYFPGNPWQFSISHTTRHVFCALHQGAVGIDAEELDRRVSPHLAARILSDSERAQYEAAADPTRALLTFWVLKEAAAKRSGEGLRGVLQPTDFSLADPRVTERDGCLLAVLTEEGE